MNTKHLQYLIEVQKCGSINKAAKKCFVTQSHLSRILQNVEKEVGFDIFDRIGNNLDLTAGGKLFFDSIQKIAADCHAIANIPRYVQPEHNLSVACSPSSFLTQCYFEFNKFCPEDNTNDKYREAGLKQCLDLISIRAVRFGYLVMSMNSHEKYRMLAEPYNLKLHTLRTNLVLHVVMHEGHPLADKPLISKKDVLQYPVLVDVDVDFEDTLKWLLNDDNHSTLAYSSRGTLMDALRLGKFCAIQIKADDDNLDHYGLCQKPISDLASYMMICLMQPKYIELSKREEKFIEFTNNRIKNFFGTRIECRL